MTQSWWRARGGAEAADERVQRAVRGAARAARRARARVRRVAARAHGLSQAGARAKSVRWY